MGPGICVGLKAISATEATYLCPYRFPFNGDCQSVGDISPYDSIPSAMWWAIVTMTTVGAWASGIYCMPSCNTLLPQPRCRGRRAIQPTRPFLAGFGDMVPTQWYGKAAAMATMLIGILVIALPITIIGSNFMAVYAEYVLKEVGAYERSCRIP